MSTATRDRKRQGGGGRRPSADYLELVRAFPLRPIRNAREYDQAAAVLSRLAVHGEGTLTAGEQDYLDTLTLLVETYDDEHFAAETAAMKPVEALRYLMDQSGMTQVELGRLLGNQALASLILNGHRELSKAHIRRLANHFKVEPGLFLDGD